MYMFAIAHLKNDNCRVQNETFSRVQLNGKNRKRAHFFRGVGLKKEHENTKI